MQENIAELPAPEDFAELTNKSVIKAAALLTELGRHRDGSTATEVAKAVKMTRPTAFRLLLTLEQTGLVDRVDNRYMLGWQIARLGKLANPFNGMVARVQPILDDHAARINETLGFSVLQDELSYQTIAEASGSRYLQVNHFYVGAGYPLHASASGKIMLAELNDERIVSAFPEVLERYTPETITKRSELLREIHRVRQQGYAVLDNELEEGLFAVALAVRDASGDLLGILSVNGPDRLKALPLEHTIAQLREVAEDLSAVLV